MRRSRLLHLFITTAVILLLHSPAEAFLGFGPGNDGDASGLDLAQGYDRNTVVIITGRVATPPRAPAGRGQIFFEMEQPSGRVVVLLAPPWYLKNERLDWKQGETVTARGSKAQGQDGRTYLLTEWIKNPAGEQIVLRNEYGRPKWSGGFNGGRRER